MSLSVNTNTAALTALENLNKTNQNLTDIQNEISTGLSVSSAKDNASVWSIAQGQRADINSLASVKSSLNRAASIADVTNTAGSEVSDLLVQLREKVVSAMDPSLSTTSRTALNADYQATLRQISQVVNSASFDGANILNGSLTSNIQFLANAQGNSFITLSTKDMSLSGPIITLAATSTINTVTSATSNLALLDASLANVNQALGDLGAQSSQISAHITFVGKLSDTLTSGVGNLVDADMAKDSARLQALQVQQQLGAQSLSIANQAPQVVLSLFR
ncbi:flagellin [Caulobacter sp. KR2-114]|uniref:flagellin n=1 Tax=Caulobacter sp. KR2-114 TaxID=3400912 RepID=UPI003BFDDD0E